MRLLIVAQILKHSHPGHWPIYHRHGRRLKYHRQLLRRTRTRVERCRL